MELNGFQLYGSGNGLTLMTSCSGNTQERSRCAGPRAAAANDQTTLPCHASEAFGLQA